MFSILFAAAAAKGIERILIYNVLSFLESIIFVALLNICIKRLYHERKLGKNL
jgi:hypothetical protein